MKKLNKAAKELTVAQIAEFVSKDMVSKVESGECLGTCYFSCTPDRKLEITEQLEPYHSFKAPYLSCLNPVYSIINEYIEVKFRTYKCLTPLNLTSFLIVKDNGDLPTKPFTCKYYREEDHTETKMVLCDKENASRVNMKRLSNIMCSSGYAYYKAGEDNKVKLVNYLDGWLMMMPC